MFEDFIDFVKEIYGDHKVIPLHEPLFLGNEKKYLSQCIDSTFVSSAGVFVDLFEEKIAEYVGVNYAVATSNGTSALHIALIVSGVNSGDEVITQPLTFVATCNAISYCGASPIFLDVDEDTMGLSPKSLLDFLLKNTSVRNKECVNNKTGQVIKACVPMHTFGHPCKIDEIKNICDKFYINLVEDAAEGLGSFYKGTHTGTFGSISTISFNGNKIITSGGGGCIITDNEELALRAKHLTTTAKVPHKWEYSHDMIGYNYRMPNINAALLIAQLENLENFLKSKRSIAIKYKDFLKNKSYRFVEEPNNCQSNYWLNSIKLNDKNERDMFLNETNAKGITTRPIWTLMHKLNMFKGFQYSSLRTAEYLQQTVVNVPSSAIPR